MRCETTAKNVVVDAVTGGAFMLTGPNSRTSPPSMRPRWLVRRIAFALLTTWIVLTLAFGFIALTEDPGEAAVAFQVGSELAGTGMSGEEIDAEIEAAIEEYRAERGLDRPTHEVYLDWVGGVLRGEWGHSELYGQPVTALIGERLAVTAAYVLPGMAVAVAGGVALGTYAALGRRRALARAITGSSYVVYGIPGFWIASIVLLEIPVQYRMYVLSFDLARPMTASTNLSLLAVAAAVLGSGLIAGQARYVRTEVLDVQSHPFVRTHRAMGGSPASLRRKVLRVAAVPLTTLFFSTLLGVLVLNVVVIEYVFEIPGFGTLLYRAILDHDLPLVVGTTLVVALVGVVGNLLQDLTYELLDPRVRIDR